MYCIPMSFPIPIALYRAMGIGNDIEKKIQSCYVGVITIYTRNKFKMSGKAGLIIHSWSADR